MCCSTKHVCPNVILKCPSIILCFSWRWRPCSWKWLYMVLQIWCANVLCKRVSFYTFSFVVFVCGKVQIRICGYWRLLYTFQFSQGTDLCICLPSCSPSVSINYISVCATERINKSQGRCPPIGLSKHPMADSYAHEVSHEGDQLWPDTKGEAAGSIANKSASSPLSCIALCLFGELASKAITTK